MTAAASSQSSFAVTLRQRANAACLRISKEKEESSIANMVIWLRNVRGHLKDKAFIEMCADNGEMFHIFKAPPVISFQNGETCADGVARWSAGEYMIYILGEISNYLDEERVTSLIDFIKLPAEFGKELKVTTNWSHRLSECENLSDLIHWSSSTHKPTAPQSLPTPFIKISWEVPKKVEVVSKYLPGLKCFNEY